MTFGTKDARGIYQFGEDDAEATFSQLLNRGMQSVSDATKYFSGTPAQRAALTPAPDGAIWQDTDSAGKMWLGRGGTWAEVSTVKRLPVGDVLTPASGRTITGYALEVSGTLSLKLNVSGNVDNTAVCTLKPGFRPLSDCWAPAAGPTAVGQFALLDTGLIWAYTTSATTFIDTQFSLA